MAKLPREKSKYSRVEKKSIHQKRDRRKSGLEKKALEYSEIYRADDYLGIRIRQSGKVFIFSADASGFWAFLHSHLISASKNCGHNFPNA